MRASSILFPSLVCALLVSFAGVSEAKKGKKRRAQKSKVGDYDGVRAGASSITPPGAHGKHKRRAAAYWVGFEQKEAGSSRVFVQLGKEVTTEQWVHGTSLVVHLPKIRIGNRAVQRFLDTRYFDTSIQNIRTKMVRARKAKDAGRAHGAGMQLIIDYKNPADLAEAVASVTTEADGYSYLYLDFSPGTEVVE